jgi:limonene-1,2-epoxide hydrolase
MGTGIERIVLDFVHAAYGERMDVEAMTALMADDFIWQLNVPLSPIIRGRDAARAELEKHNQLASGMVDGSEIRTVVSNEDTVVVERLDVNLIAGKRVTFHVTAISKSAMARSPAGASTGIPATSHGSSAVIRYRCLNRSAPDLHLKRLGDRRNRL